MTSIFRGAHILITGGAGFIGSHIADQVLAAGAARVVVLDDFVQGRVEHLGAAFETGRLTMIGADICDTAAVDRATRGVHFVFHQAALRMTHCADAPQRAVDVMIRGTQNVLDAAVHHSVSKVIAASSASVYGEPSYLPIGEPHPFNNRTLYGALKIANEQMLRAYAEMYGLRYVALRPFDVYGPRMDACGLSTEVMLGWLERLARGEAPVIFGDGARRWTRSTWKMSRARICRPPALRSRTTSSTSVQARKPRCVICVRSCAGPPGIPTLPPPMSLHAK